jgi:hypothetical protein
VQDVDLDPLTAAILCAGLVQGLIGAAVVLPIVCINWTWNSVLSQYTLVPPIAWWQAALLYLAVAAAIYVSGFFRIEFSTETID